MFQFIVLPLAVIGIAGAGFVLSMRTKFGPVQSLVRRTNRRFMNPRQLAKAGRTGSWASVVDHVGRASGKQYRTPVAVAMAEGDFVVPLPYGPTADWVRNVLAAGEATITHDGDDVHVISPELQGPAANRWFSDSEQRQHRVFGVSDFLVLRRG